MSLSELGTIHDLCELERTQILKYLTSAVLKINYAENLLSANRSNFNDYVTTLALNNFHKQPFVFEDEGCYQRLLIFYKTSTFCEHLIMRHILWDNVVPCGSEKIKRR